jgi:hypothetical protein
LQGQLAAFPQDLLNATTVTGNQGNLVGKLRFFSAQQTLNDGKAEPQT